MTPARAWHPKAIGHRWTKSGVRVMSISRKLRASSSKVDATAANAARHDDYLARVNPIIVERFLTRIAKGELLRCDPAPIGDDGFFYLSVSPTDHGWKLPTSLPSSNGTTLVTTRADARQKAIDDGHERAADTVMLGPSDPALTTLVMGLRERVEPGDVARRCAGRQLSA